MKGGGIPYSDLTGDSSLARAFESKHGHLQLRGSSRSSIDEAGSVNFLLGLLLIIDSTRGAPSSKLV